MRDPLPGRALSCRVGLLTLVALLCACRGTPPEAPDASSVEWARYDNPVVGFSMEYPDSYAVDEEADGLGVIFRHDGYPVIAIRHVDERESDRRGLWGDHEPVDAIELAGRRGKRYDYNHSDGPFYMRTVSYVVAHRGKFLGVEFRTNLDRPDAIQQRVLDSIRLDD